MESTYKSHNPTILVILGATGDLTRKKLIPALFNLYQKKLFPPLFQIIGFSRGDLSDTDFRDKVKLAIPLSARATDVEREGFARLFIYKQGFFDAKEGYENLEKYLGKQDGQWRVCSNKLFYLAVPPDYYKQIFNHLSDSGLAKPCSPEEGWTRVVVEKPFGRDSETAEELDRLLGRLFREEQIYRIDHYLGKETVQNILALRFSNSFFEPSWNRKHIESIHVDISQELGVEERADFYDTVGALRDIGQNHSLQLLALIMMDHPGSFDAESIRKKKTEILRSLKPIRPGQVKKQAIRGQYVGYLKEAGVAPGSETETYFRVTAFSDSSRWKGVPIYLESGKRLSRSKAEVVVIFRHNTPCLCPPESGQHYQNVLRYQIQPEEGVRMSFWVKRPGAIMALEEKDFSFNYQSAYSKELFIDPYEKLILDVFEGNQTLFVSTNEIKASWKFIDPIIDAWHKNRGPLIVYEPGTLPSVDDSL